MPSGSIVSPSVVRGGEQRAPLEGQGGGEGPAAAGPLAAADPARPARPTPGPSPRPRPCRWPPRPAARRRRSRAGRRRWPAPPARAGGARGRARPRAARPRTAAMASSTSGADARCGWRRRRRCWRRRARAPGRCRWCPTGSPPPPRRGAPGDRRSGGHRSANLFAHGSPRLPCEHGRMLQVRELAVEVGGTVILDGASFSIRARDKVGLVGRNGAGKTSLLKVLGGAGRPLRRRRAPQRRPRLPARRTRGSTASTRPPRPCATSSPGRGFDEAMVRIEKLRLQMEEDPSERAVSRFTRAEEQFRLDGGYAAESEVRRIAAGLGLEADRLDLPDRRRCPVGRSGGSRSPASSSPAATCSCSTSPPTTSTATPRSGCSASCAPTGARSS